VFRPAIKKENDRMKKALIALATLAFAVPAAAQSWQTGTLDQAIAKAKAESKLVLLDFYSGG
jgi:hypothetical protein